MNNPLTLLAGDTEAWHEISITGQFVTILEAAFGIEIRGNNRSPFQVDDADEVDFGFDYADGGEIWVRNLSEDQNHIVIAASSYYVRRKKSVELTADLSSINVAGGEVGIDPAKNNVKVTNKVELEETQVVKTEQQGQLDIGNFPAFPASFNVDNLPADKKYTVTYETHLISAVEVAAGWTFNNGTAERLIISATKDVRLGFTDFAEGEKLDIKDLAPNQDFIFKGLENNEIDIIKFTAVA